MHKLLLSLLGTCFALSLSAQIIIYVTENGQPMVGHSVTVSHGDHHTIGTGYTDGSGYAYISGYPQSQSVDVAGYYQNGGTTRKWSIKGKIVLDGNNYTHIRLEDIAAGINTDFPKLSDDIGGFGDNGFGNNGFGDDGGGSQKRQAAPQDYHTAMQDIKNTSSSFDKADKAKALASGTSMSSAQIRDLISQLNSTFDRKDVAISAYARCTDPENYRTVTQTFTSSMMRKEVEDATINK